MKKKLLIFLIIIFLTSLLGIFMVGNKVIAQEWCPGGEDEKTPYECPPKLSTSDDGSESKNIRLQVSIPGITKTCKYNVQEMKNNKLEPVTKKCHHVESNLPAYIKTLYSFLIGVIAIIAVISIMVGGLKWILAAGNATVIGAARQQITAAVAGLILALCSFVILNMINPSLTNLRPIDPKNVDTIEQATTWCADFPKYYNKAKNQLYVFAKEGDWGGSRVSYTGSGASGYEYNCGDKYQFGYEVGVGGEKFELGKGQTCMGNYCGGGKRACFTESGYSFCIDPKEYCESLPNEVCDSFNQKIDHYSESTRGKSCAKRDDYGLKGRDQCVWGDRMFCPNETIRAESCLSTPGFNGQTGCWIYDGAEKVPINYNKGSFLARLSGESLLCVDSEYSNSRAHLICCGSKGTDSAGNEIIEFKVYGKGIRGAPEAYIPECKSIDNCSDYLSEDAKKYDPCKVCPSF